MEMYPRNVRMLIVAYIQLREEIRNILLLSLCFSYIYILKARVKYNLTVVLLYGMSF